MKRTRNKINFMERMYMQRQILRHTHTHGLLIWFSYLIYDWGVINGPFNSAFTHRARTHTYTYIFINYLHWIWFIRFGFGDHFSPLLQIIIHSSVGNMKFMERCAALTQLLIYLFTASRGVLQMFKLVSRYDAVHTRKHSLSVTYDAMGISINQHSFFVYKMFLDFFTWVRIGKFSYDEGPKLR